VRARRASLEPSVASRIFVGNMLISSLLLDGFPYLVFRINRHNRQIERIKVSCIRCEDATVQRRLRHPFVVGDNERQQEAQPR
jgi:hypothetical protein